MPPVRPRRPAGEEASAREAAILGSLRSAGGRVTTGRRAIVRALVSSADHHVTAEALARSVQAEHPDVHLSTVYRTLEALEAAHVVDRVDLGAGGAVFHLTDGDHAHDHLICTGCGAVTEVGPELLADLAAAVRRQHRFEVTGRLVLRGRCARCAGSPDA